MEEYDYIILGTGIIECMLSELLSRNKKKVLQIDKHKNYGSSLRSLSYSEIVSEFNKQPVEELLKLDRKFSIDLVPKTILSNGNFEKYLEGKDLTEIISFKLIPTSYVYKDKLYVIPTNEKKSLETKILGLWQKTLMVKFFWDIRKVVKKSKKMEKTMREEFKSYGLSKEAIELVGHAIALNLDDDYLEKSPMETYENIILYLNSIITHNKESSPYIYPLYGLSEISQAFSRRSAVYGSEFRLNTQILEIERINAEKEYEDIFEKEIISTVEKIQIKEHQTKILKTKPSKGFKIKLKGIDGESEILAKKIISEPSYFPNNINIKQKVIRCICIVKGNINFLPTCKSSQVLFLKDSLNRENDIFLLTLGEPESTTPSGYNLVIISTIQETEDPEKEISWIIDKLGDVIDIFFKVEEIYEVEKEENNIFISNSIDQSTHLEGAFKEFVSIFHKLKEKDSSIEF